MKRRAKSYLVTHVAYDAVLRPLSKAPPLRLAKPLFLLFTFLWFILGVVFAHAQLVQLPPNPSGDFPTFKRQLLLYNVNRVVEGVKQANPEVKKVDAIVQLTQNATASYKPSPLFVTKFGIRPTTGIIYSEIGVYPVRINYSLDTFNKNYSSSLGYSRFTGTYAAPLDSHNYTISIDSAWKLE